MATFGVNITRKGQFDIIIDVKEITSISKVESSSALFTIGGEDDAGFTFTLGRKHPKKEESGDRNVIEFHIKRTGHDLVVGDGLCFIGPDHKMRVFKITGRI